ncbi:TPA: DUF2726 domain-containing protein [Escherichia coli]|jgi:hypothetical protein|uniref:DUF2726 domain-containing protein n=3 Tax=Escherichia coli TaxID=562 RepID=UPI0004D88F42|nr:DUF2726 domain-containing protein [Escherichia coli]KDX37590.1 hypothetical protein AC16_5513 [Escherichia coli 2-177-06_S3_C2]KEJ70123.1 hypothetical protein AB67_5351 [Escherichia coli 5-366-08_S1_C3]EKI9505523.1 DUF2726 domain-containing protein [Escherichia coli]KDX39987.1 hypothetical protein AC16_5144 [Escherichia coli 2-177-06_S3_C2]
MFSNISLWQIPFVVLLLVIVSFFSIFLFLAIYSLGRSVTEKKSKNGTIQKSQHNVKKNILNYASTPHPNYKLTSKDTHSFQYDSFHFYQKKNFMTNRERFFFNLVYNEFHHEFFIFSQVRMVDIIIPIFDKNTQYNSYIKAFRSISQYHIDFLIVDKTNFSIVCAIELDDYSHDLPDRIKRDNKINMIFKFAGIPLLRSRKTTELLNKIRYYIQQHNFN